MAAHREDIPQSEAFARGENQLTGLRPAQRDIPAAARSWKCKDAKYGVYRRRRKVVRCHNRLVNKLKDLGLRGLHSLSKQTTYFAEKPDGSPPTLDTVASSRYLKNHCWNCCLKRGNSSPAFRSPSRYRLVRCCRSKPARLPGGIVNTPAGSRYKTGLEAEEAF